MSDRYRLNKRQHFRVKRIPGEVTPGFTKFVKGDVLVPTASELAFHPNIFEPVAADTPLTIGLVRIGEDGEVIVGAKPVETEIGTAVVTQVSVREKAQQILNQKEPQIREAIRQADAELLQAMGDIENASGSPRSKIVNAIQKRQESL